MTFCKLLAEKTNDGKTISAWEKYDKQSVMPRYEITVSKDNIVHEIINAARTTWKKRYNEFN